MKKICIFLPLALAAALSCQRQTSSLDLPDQVPVRFRATNAPMSAAIGTKTDEVTTAGLTEFYAAATTGSSGSEVSKWGSYQFTGTPGGLFSGSGSGKWWPRTDEDYHFYASNLELHFDAGGTTVEASTETDVVCTFLQWPEYKETNNLLFEHIFARIGNVTVTAETGYTITDVSLTLTPRVSGTYNLRSGYEKTDGTGWSAVEEGEEVSLANATPGTKANDLWLIPGQYLLTASWTATAGDYTQTFENKTVAVSITGGLVNTLSTTLGGNSKEIKCNVAVASWGGETVDAGYVVKECWFAGLKIAPGPLYYDGESFAIKDTWQYDSYRSAHGLEAGSCYFSFIELGQLFEKADFSKADGDIDNILDPLDGWRLPTKEEWERFVTTSADVRDGSTVNGQANKHYALVQLSGHGVKHAGASLPNGMLLFPDRETITGKTLAGMDNGTQTTGMTLAELNEYLRQGCAFLPSSGFMDYTRWEHAGWKGCFWFSDEAYSTTVGYYCQFKENDVAIYAVTKENDWFSARLVYE